jgi:hypothetical protein
MYSRRPRSQSLARTRFTHIKLRQHTVSFGNTEKWAEKQITTAPQNQLIPAPFYLRGMQGD